MDMVTSECCHEDGKELNTTPSVLVVSDFGPVGRLQGLSQIGIDVCQTEILWLCLYNSQFPSCDDFTSGT